MTASHPQNTPESTETPPALQADESTPVPVNGGEASGQPCRGCAERAATPSAGLAGLAGHVDDIEVRAFGWAGAAIGVGLIALAVAVCALLRTRTLDAGEDR